MSSVAIENFLCLCPNIFIIFNAVNFCYSIFCFCSWHLALWYIYLKKLYSICEKERAHQPKLTYIWVWFGSSVVEHPPRKWKVPGEELFSPHTFNFWTMRNQPIVEKTRLGCFYVTAILSWCYGCGWLEAEVDLSLRLKWGWDEIEWKFSWNWVEVSWHW